MLKTKTTKEENCRKGKNSGREAGEERRRDLKIFSSKNMRILYNKYKRKESKNQISGTVDLSAGGITNSKREQRGESER